MSESLPWHATEAQAVLATLDAPSTGLSSGEAERRLARDGPNAITERRGATWIRTLAEQLVQPLVVVLIVAAILSWVLGDHVDAAVIAAVVVLNALIGFVQEYRAERAIAALGELVITEATAVRDGDVRRLPSERLVVGDIVELHAGDAVPADVRLIAAKELRVEEAALTGESVPSAKSLGVLPPDAPLGDRTNLAFAGSAVTHGQARGVVVAVGDQTQAGQISGLMAGATRVETPLTLRIAQLSRLLVAVILVAAAALFGIEAARGRPLAETFNAAVALAVGAIPEGLPAAVTVLLAVGVSSMARRNALIRRLPAVETLGSTTVICSDKTGTLTENQMTVTAAVVGQVEHELTGVGFETSGEVRRDGEAVDPRAAPALIECLRAGALCNDSRLVKGEAEGDPTEVALLVAARKVGLDEVALAQWPRRDVVPFESEHMYMATLHDQPDGGRIVYVKGSPEVLLRRCVDRLEEDGARGRLDVEQVSHHVDALAERGLRVLLTAMREAPGTSEISHADVDQLTLIGLVGMIDPPRPEAKAAVAACRSAGVQVKMITGDHAVTAAAIAAELELEGERDPTGRLRAVTGRELAALSEQELPEVADRVAVFARVAPEQKLALVRALQGRRQVVAMTGDGVNDAPALEQADIGIAMGRGGTDVARSASAMILTDDNFATIAAAVEEGRGIYDNLVKFVAWTLPTNGGEGTVLLAAIVFGTQLPVLPVQLLWVNMATTVLLGLTLVVEPHEPGLMDRPPRPVQAPILGPGLVGRTVAVSLLIGGGAFGLFEWAQEIWALPVDQARTIAVNTIVVVEVGYLFACRSLRLPLLRVGLLTNPWTYLGAAGMLCAQLAFTYLPVMNELFHSAPIAPWWWAAITGVGLAVFVLAELWKLVPAGRGPPAGLRRHHP
jgi:cation-transporting P-type ATPase F